MKEVLMVMVSLTLSCLANEGTPYDYGTMKMYRQSLKVDASEDVLTPTIAPVYDGHKWGLSTRWDDSNPNALNIHRKMLKNGIRGTFYLNSRKPEKPEGSLAQKLSKGGHCSVGGHSVSHPKLPTLPANDSFYQLMANRITLECLTDQPVNSLAFPYGQYQEKGRPEVLEAVTRAVLRTGYLHCVYKNFVMSNRHIPEGVVGTGIQVAPGDRVVDAEKFWNDMEKIRDNEGDFRKISDCIFLGVHPWQKGDELERLGQLMEKLRDWDDFWHCTQTEWAAYARQRHDTKLAIEGSGVFMLTRPSAVELGNNIPLTLVFDSTAIQAVTVDGMPCAMRKASGKTFVNVPHAKPQRVPTVIGKADQAGRCGKVPGLTGAVRFDSATDSVTVTIKNNTERDLEDAVLTVALPPACTPGLIRWQRPVLPVGETWSVTAKLARDRADDYWVEGNPYFSAQLDFRQLESRARLYAETFGERAEQQAPDTSDEPLPTKSYE